MRVVDYKDAVSLNLKGREVKAKTELDYNLNISYNSTRRL